MRVRSGSSYDLGPKTSKSQRSSSASRVTSNEPDFQRLAINPSAALGSFYDANTDEIPASLALEKTATPKRRIGKILQRQWIRSDMFETGPFLHDMGIDDDLWLHVRLSLEPVQGMASIATYSFPVSDNTRFFYYDYAHEESQISNDRNVVMSHVRKDIPRCAATHIVSEIRSGIQVFVVLELPLDGIEERDQFLEQWCTRLTVKSQPAPKKKHEKWLNDIVVREVFSNVFELEPMRSLERICETITYMQTSMVTHPLVAYRLRPIKWFYPSYPSKKAAYIPLEERGAGDLRKYILRMSSDVGELNRIFQSEVNEVWKKSFQQRQEVIQTMYLAEMDRLRDLTLEFRRGRREAASPPYLSTDSPGSILKRWIDKLVTDFSHQTLLVDERSSLSIGSPNAPPTPAQTLTSIASSAQQAPSIRQSREPLRTAGSPGDSKSAVNRQERRTQRDLPSVGQPEILPVYKTPLTKASKTGNSASFFITSTIHKAVSHTEHSLNSQVPEKVRPPSRPPSTHRSTPSSPVTASPPRPTSVTRGEKIDAEKLPDSFLPTTVVAKRPRSASRGPNPAESKTQEIPSQSHTESLREGTEQPIGQPGPILPPSAQASPSPKHKLEAPITQDLAEKSSPPKKQRSDKPLVTFTNVLLLGESGVGKSTFINALVNYLAFDSLERARSSSPLVVMPVSFLLAVGQDFEEKIVKFGDEDANEDHHHPGQSVTQQCRSYIFPYNPDRPLRIIDTPGMGDTRGLDQDDQNMQHIISYVNHLPHLDAICILLKPNESRLNVVLRSYFTRLLTFLGPEAGQNIIFCFTSCRSTFFAPGNTAPLLRAMIKQLPTQTISFGKTNTFCFDSESFRYLMALQNQIEFDTFEEQEYQKSWTASTTESRRFLQYICQSLKPYSQAKWRSIEHFQFTLRQMARPLLESIRQLYRNIIVQGKKSAKCYLKFRSKPIHQVSTICDCCERISEDFFGIWILPDQCKQCACERKHQMDIYYQIEIDRVTDNDRTLVNSFVTDVDHLETIVVSLAQLQASQSGSDSLLPYLERMITEENSICTEKGPHCLNTMVHDKLVALRQQYREKRRIGKSKPVPIDLEFAFSLIHDALEISLVSQQMQSAQQTYNTVMKQYEKQVEYKRTED